MKVSFTSFLLLIGSSAFGAIQYGSGVVPGSLADVEGNSALGFPFGGTPNRFQQVYSASEFNRFLPDGGWLARMYFRVEADRQLGGGPFGATLPLIQINFSTISKAPDSLSSIFSENVGSDDTIAFPAGSLSLSSPFFNNAAPQPFLILIEFPRPFFYSPANGNLLLDVRNYMGALTAPFDAENILDDSISRVRAEGAESTTGLADSAGLVTRFEFIPIPEPAASSMILLCLTGLGCFMAWRRKGNKATEQRH